MGFFSWNTGDTNKSISNCHSSRGALPCKMILPDGTEFVEYNYEGYGVFGNQDVFEIIAELNGFARDRGKGIDILYDDNPSGDFSIAASSGIVLPKFASLKYDGGYNILPFPRTCGNQGYFHDE